MDRYMQIAKLMKAFQRNGRVFLPATVESVEGNTCTINVDGLLISDVRLKVTNDETDDMVLITPAVGANVLAGSLTGSLSNLFILHTDSFSQAYLKAGEISFKMDKNGIEFNDGKNSGIVKVKEITEWMGKLYKDIQVLKTLLKAHPVAGQGAPLGLNWEINAPKPIQRDFEDTKVTH